ncbi:MULTISPECIES: ABC transporter permease [Brevibacterium]|uniref:ABC transporter permease n=1 Tax=Brevibacterium pityocampae TaxID=506594 RepID=A0ABP8JHY8_9MICO|nr:ABC transporter permease [Brevibacterium sp. CS2]QCP05378.1 FtsX-like permease family protein [Brevibacterium sp. CS2]
MITTFFAACVEAWQELRIHKLRVLLSLFGVGVAVCSLTVVVALGEMTSQGMRETFEREGGRAATLQVDLYPGTGAARDLGEVAAEVHGVAEEFGIGHTSLLVDTSLSTGADSQRSVSVRIVEPDYAVIHRQQPALGRWFAEGDGENRSPPIVIDSNLAERSGIDTSALPTTMRLPGAEHITATVIGVVEVPRLSGTESLFMLPSTAQSIDALDLSGTGVGAKLWVPDAEAELLAAQLEARLSKELPGYEVSAYRMDFFAGEEPDILAGLRNGLLGVSALILLLGALGLVNISVVTVRQRIREIGVRRSFGATGGRIFFSIVMESVVATFVAGVVGVVAAVLLLKSPLVTNLIGEIVTDVPPFPVSAALIGIGVSIAVGALAGVIPGAIAARVTIIDAIRQ